VRAGENIPEDAALIIIPGSKSTIADLEALRRHGWDAAIMRHHASGRPVLGVCGGYQMLGREIADPHGLEGTQTAVKGLGLLDILTVMEPEKAVRNANGHSVAFGSPISGYEIHIGRTTGPDCASSFAVVNGHPDGAISADGLVMGTYLHGLFGNDIFRRKFMARFGMNARLNAYWAEVDSALNGIAGQLDKLGLGRVISAALSP
jgi:adenosylcobyric acid synthase